MITDNGTQTMWPIFKYYTQILQKDEGKPSETLVMKLKSHPRFELGTFWMKIRYVISTETWDFSS
jgi:hypothetical protein